MLWLASLSASEAESIIDEACRGLSLSEYEVEILLKHIWELHARDAQLAPPGNWTVWALITGRGFGKNRTLAEWCHQRAEDYPGSHGFIAGRTLTDARETILHHPRSGIVATSKPWNPCMFNASRRMVSWANGSFAHVYTSEEPDLARGPEHDWGVADEIASWRRVKDIQGNTTWTNLRLGLRGLSGDMPRMVAGTTPRPNELILKLLKDAKDRPDDVVITTGTTYDNKANLAPAFVEAVEGEYGGTRVGRQELLGEVLFDVEGAIVTRDLIDDTRVDEIPSDLNVLRSGVAVDPGEAIGSMSGTGIVGGSLMSDGHVYIQRDRTARVSPLDWARRACETRDELGSDTVVAEKNHGGEMVKTTIRTVDPLARVLLVTASRGKHIRFGPVGSFWEQKRIHIVGSMKVLEDQVCCFTDAGYEADGSPHNADALVWLVHYLLLGLRGTQTGLTMDHESFHRESVWRNAG